MTDRHDRPSASQHSSQAHVHIKIVAPVGYQSTGSAIRLHPTQAAVVREVFKAYLAR